MVTHAELRDPAGPTEFGYHPEVDTRVVVQTTGFDGVQRVLSLLRQRRYPVEAFNASVVGRSGRWTVTFTLQVLDQEPLLLARLNRLPSVLGAEKA